MNSTKLQQQNQQSNASSNRPAHCAYCNEVGHFLREKKDDPNSAFTCPKKLAMSCPECAAKGRYHFGHYLSRCPFREDRRATNVVASTPAAPAVAHGAAAKAKTNRFDVLANADTNEVEDMEIVVDEIQPVCSREYANRVKLAPLGGGAAPKAAATTVAPERKFCTYCKNKNKSEEEYTSHFLRESKEDNNSRYTCPEILKIKCMRCHNANRYAFGHYSTQCTFPETEPAPAPAPAPARAFAPKAPVAPVAPVAWGQGTKTFTYLLLHDGHRALAAFKSPRHYYFELGTRVSKLYDGQKKTYINSREPGFAAKQIVFDPVGMEGMNAGQYVLPGGLIMASTISDDTLKKWSDLTGCPIVETPYEDGSRRFVFTKGGFVSQPSTAHYIRFEADTKEKSPCFILKIQFSPKELDCICQEVNAVLGRADRDSLRHKLLDAYQTEKPSYSLLPKLEEFPILSDELVHVKIVSFSGDDSFRHHFRDPVQQAWFYQAMEKTITQNPDLMQAVVRQEVPEEDF